MRLTGGMVGEIQANICLSQLEYHLYVIGSITIPTMLLLLLHLGWKQLTHLVNAEGLNPDLSQPGHASIEQTFTGTATCNDTAHKLDIQLY